MSEVIEDSDPRGAPTAPGGLETICAPLPVFTGGQGTQPRVDLSDNSAVQALLDEGLPLDALR